jgi:hypothetical protein
MSAAAVSKRLLPLALALSLVGCATITAQDTIATVNRNTQAFANGDVQLLQSQAQRVEAQAQIDSLLRQPLTQNDAVKVMLLGSPSFQALLAQGIASSAGAAQTGRIANPSLSVERMSSLADTELTRVLTFGLLDVLMLPTKQRYATQMVHEVELRLAADVVQGIAQTRQAWVKAVAAKQRLSYAQQVMRSANASAELAARLQRVGNITVVARSQQHLYAADAAVALANAQHAHTSAQEALTRALGLRAQQLDRLQLPERLPDLPKQYTTPEEVSAQAMAARLDVRMAAQLAEAAGVAQQMQAITSLTDVEWGIRRVRTTDKATGDVATSSGNEISIKLPLFDWGDATRTRMNAQALAALSQYEATLINASSQLREAYSAYRTTFDIAQHYQHEVIPLRMRISEENQYRYNGMLISTFDLLADARAQVSVVQAALGANEQFWLADVVLNAHVVGSPMMQTAMGASAGADAAMAGGAAH